MADVSRLVLQVDASVELARRNLAALAAAVEGDSQKMDRALKTVDEAHSRLGKSSGSARVAQMEFMHVVTASTDALNAGMPVSRVFAMEIGRIAEAAQFAAGAGGLGGFAKYLTGGYGIALQIGISALAMLAGGHHGAGEAAGEHKTAEEKLKDAVKAVADATKNLNDNELVTIQRHLDAARAAEAQAQSLIKVARAKLEAAKADLVAEDKRASDPTLAQEGGINVSFDVAAARGRSVSDLEKELARLTAQFGSAQRSAAEAELRFGHILGAARSDPERAAEFQANQRDILLDQDFRRRTAGRDITAADRNWLAQREAELATQREAGMRAAQAAAEAERQLSNNREQGRQVSLAEAESIVRGIGGRVTSAQRSTAQQAELYARYQAGTGSLAAPPGHSLHETGQALDIAKGGGMSLGRIREAFQARGIQIRELLDEGNHFHVGFGKAGPSDETVANRAQAAADRRRRDQEDYTGAQSQASQRLAAAQEEAAKHSEDALDLQISRIGAEKQGLDEATRRNAIEHHWSQAETNTVLELNRRWAQTKVATAIATDEAKNARDRLQIDQASLRTDTDVAHLHAQLAETARDRRASALILLDLSQQQERNDLEGVLASKTATDAEKQIARDRLGRLGELRDLSAQVIDRQYETPGQRYRRDLGAKDINEQLDEVKVRGLQSLEDELAGVISGTESVSSAFKRMASSIIADLARIAIEKEIIMPLANMLFGGGGGGGGASASSLFDLFSQDAGIQGFAGGGDPPVGKWSLVGERGPELVKFKSPATVIPNHMLGRGGGGGAVHLAVHISTSDMLEAHVQETSARTVGQAAPGISAHAARQVVQLLTRPRLN